MYINLYIHSLCIFVSNKSLLNNTFVMYIYENIIYYKKEMISRLTFIFREALFAKQIQRGRQKIE